MDRVAVDRAMRGQPASISTLEARVVVARLRLEQQLGIDEIARRIGYSRSQVADMAARMPTRR